MSDRIGAVARHDERDETDETEVREEPLRANYAKRVENGISFISRAIVRKNTKTRACAALTPPYSGPRRAPQKRKARLEAAPVRVSEAAERERKPPAPNRPLGP